MVDRGYDLEIIDIWLLKLFDMYIIGELVRKMYWVLIVEECMWMGGIGVSLRLVIMESFWDELDGLIGCLLL